MIPAHQPKDLLADVVEHFSQEWLETKNRAKSG